MTKTVLTMSQVMEPCQANLSGNVHGGEIMKFMDTVAGATAVQYSKGNVVTARVDELDFHQPIYIGAFVTCTGKIAYVGNTSMEVSVVVEVQDLESDEEPVKALSAFFTMVALDEDGNPRTVEPWTPKTDWEKAMHHRIEEKRAYYKRKREEQQ